MCNLLTLIGTLINAFEKMLEEHPKIIDLITSFGTWAAVLVSLWLGMRSVKSKLTASAQISRIIPGGINKAVKLDEYPLNLTISITNHGPQVVYFSYFSTIHWKVPFSKVAALQNPATDFRSKDLELLPGKSLCLVLTDDPKELFVEKLSAEALKLKFFAKQRLKYIQLYVSTTSGQTIKAKLNRDTRSYISNPT